MSKHEIDPEEQSEGSEELYERMNLTVDRGQEPMRLDKFLVARIEGASRNKVQQAIETGRVTINGKTVASNYKIKPRTKLWWLFEKRLRLKPLFNFSRK